MVQTLQDVYGLVVRSRLVPADEARALFDRWQTEATERPADPQRFIGWLVANNHLTDYQGALLIRGFADGFFLNEYKVLERLGRGRMAGVYKAQHRLGQIVAIKVLPPSKAREPNMKSRFQREARLALQLKHPNVVRTFEVGEANGLHYLVMEYLEGETLAELFARQGKLLPEEAVRLMFEALQGLEHIHKRGLVHRDIKPSNLMLVYPGRVPTESAVRGRVKILDIGLGRPLLEEGPPGQETALTSEGIVLGTPDYMAPEQARDARSADIRADIYSLGCVLYQALAGRPPFTERNLLTLMIRHATEDPQPLAELNPAVPPGLQKIIGRMMAKEADERYPTPALAAEALREFLADDSDGSANPENDPGMRAYLDWLEGQIIHADLPTWLAEMDTVTVSEVRRDKPTGAGEARPAPPVRPSRSRIAPPELPEPGEKTKIVRKLPRAARPLPQLVPAAAADGATAGHEADFATPSTAAEAMPLLPRILDAGEVLSRFSQPQKHNRRALLAFASGLAIGSLVALIVFLVAPVFRSDQPPASEGGAKKRRATP
jgi:eukaryotic-like serine/threonine-protein kinase